MLTREQADAIEAEMRALQADPATTVEQMRLFMQHPMPCGHAVGNLLTCDSPPFGCVICGEPAALDPAQLRTELAAALDAFERIVSAGGSHYVQDTAREAAERARTALAHPKAPATEEA